VSYRALLRSELNTFQLDLPIQSQEMLARYCGELDRWNRRMNLTALKSAELVRRLVVEPVWVGAALKMTGSLLDIGSGNGSPAIPLAVTRPFDKTQLIEARTRRVVFIRHCVAALELSNISVHKSRLEEAGGLEPADWVTLQGVRLTPDILKTLLVLRKPTTKIVWITSTGTNTAWPQSRRLGIPHSNSEIHILSLDLF
jgi:16S rRNA (guanine(527)-N(7))-methyltransferase RsmG